MPRIVVIQEGKKEPAKLESADPRVEVRPGFSGLAERGMEGPPVFVDAPLASPENQRLALEVGGAMAGGTLGGLSPVPGGALAGAAAGGAVGSGLAELVDPTERPAEAAAVAGATALAGEGVGRAAIGIGGRLLRGTALKEGASEAIGQLAERGETLTPALASESRVLSTVENIAENAIFGGTRIEATRRGAERAAQEAVEEFAEQFITASTREEVGELVQLTLDANREAFKATARGMFRQVDDLVEGVTIPFEDVQQLAREILRESEQGLNLGSLREVAKSVESKGAAVTFETAQALRSDLAAVGRVGTDLIPGRAQAAAKRLAKAVDSAMESSLEGLPNPALDAWRAANAFWKKGAQEFNGALLKRIARAEPEAVVDQFLKNRKPGSIRRVKRLLADDDAWRGVQGAFLGRVLEKARSATGDVAARSIQQQLKSFGDEGLRELFPPEALKTLRRSVRTLELAQGNVSGPGGMAIQLAQGGGLVIGPGSILAGADSATALAGTGVIFVGPALLARFLTNPTVSRWLTAGLKAPPGSKTAARAMAQLGAIAARDRALSDPQDVRSDRDQAVEFVRGATGTARNLGSRALRNLTGDN